MKKINVILLVVIAISAGLLFTLFLGMSLGEEASEYVDFRSAKNMDKKVHVVGTWVRDYEQNDLSDVNTYSFYLQDSLQNVELVRYNDPKPPNFESAEKVVVIGGYNHQEGLFEADKILMKCPSKYNETELSGT